MTLEVAPQNATKDLTSRITPSFLGAMRPPSILIAVDVIFMFLVWKLLVIVREDKEMHSCNDHPHPIRLAAPMLLPLLVHRAIRCSRTIS